VYDSFGNVTKETNVESVDVLFGYTGRPFDEATGLQNNLNRWYDSWVGTWISEDPIGLAGGDANVYQYVGNQPTGSIDPSGLYEVPVIQPLINYFTGLTKQRRKTLELEAERRRLLQRKAAENPDWISAYAECRRQTPEEVKELMEELAKIAVEDAATTPLHATP
jgi:RHS repeat-associated protein